MRSRGSRLQFNLVKLKDTEVADLFEATVACKFAALNPLEENIDNLTENIHGAFVDKAPEVLENVRKKKNPWMTNDILDLCGRRRNPPKKLTKRALWQYRSTAKSIKQSEAK